MHFQTYPSAPGAAAEEDAGGLPNFTQDQDSNFSILEMSFAMMMFSPKQLTIALDCRPSVFIIMDRQSVAHQVEFFRRKLSDFCAIFTHLLVIFTRFRHFFVFFAAFP